MGGIDQKVRGVKGFELKKFELTTFDCIYIIYIGWPFIFHQVGTGYNLNAYT